MQAQLERMALEPGEALMIGDNINDGLEAAQAGVTAILVPTGDTSRRRLRESGFPVADSLIDALNGVITSL